MQMRLGFVRALLHDPDVLFLDEPTAGLDPVNARIVKDVILEQSARDRTILLTTHNMVDVEELCDTVGFLVDGAMSVTDAPDALEARYGHRSVRVKYRDDVGSPRSADFPLDGLGRDEGFLELLRTRRIDSVHSQEASLDQVFAHVTGASLAAGV
jgi:fluoroquinolone transport system ATP-binding protein